MSLDTWGVILALILVNAVYVAAEFAAVSVSRSRIQTRADEGIALLSESDEERSRHVQVAADAANAGNLIPLKALCAASEYPKNVAAFFSESFLLTKLLVDRKDRA